MTAPAAVDPVEEAPAPPKRKASKAVEGMRILRLVALGKLRKHACARVGVNLKTFEKWVELDAEFLALYQVARVQQAHSLAEEMVELSDLEVGSDMAEVQRNRLRVDTRKWYVSKLAPKLYGERVEHEHKHTVGVVMLPAIGHGSGQGIGSGLVTGTATVSQLTSTGPEDEREAGREDHYGTGVRRLLARSMEGPVMTLAEVRARTMGTGDSQSPATEPASDEETEA